MTRINVAILPKELPSKLLLAELREIKRIPNCIKSGRYNMKGQPEIFTLGTGHVKFFYDKLQYLRTRYETLYEEAILRGYNVQNFLDAWEGCPEHLMGTYKPTGCDRILLVDRILSKNFELIN